MIDKIIYFFYYLIFYNLPNGRFFSGFNIIRRFYICKIMKVCKYHKNTRIQNNVYISSPNKVKIGKNCQINENVFIQGAIIGDNVMIAPNVSILSNVKDTSNLNIPMNMQGWKEKNKYPTIGDDVWIGRNAIIMPGIHIGNGSIVGAGSVVTKNIKKYSIIGGVPANIIRSRLDNEK